ncbi:hypothetical protein C2S53_015394 [Perilla frutescens var. hirtella]|uniref:S-protein homolog n=1 Tax=Perilla frutescens var. hirtella TaxID=608512 RepID=A0AAD4J5N5_PERFH|nr:hypothetical protein C2S53_015394 [Perilla frutescens var. hirtella]
MVVVAQTIHIGLPKETQRYEVYVFDVLPQTDSKLIRHCYSGDDDFGNHTLYFNQYQTWNFYVNIFKTTLFSCRLWWGRKTKAFEAFNAKHAKKCETGLANACSWVAKEDGVYFSPNEHYQYGLVKEFDWE